MTDSEKSSGILLEDETLRDGLQVESRIFSIEEKLAIFLELANAGIRRIQVGSFVNPQKVPQMADTEEFIRVIRNQSQGAERISALILNDRGLERALQCGLRHVSMSVSASNTHSLKNAGKPAAEALQGMAGLIRQATDSGMTVRAGLQCSFGCVYEGAIAESAVLAAAGELAAAGAAEINLADTTGMANPLAVERLVGLVQSTLPGLPISLHLHDTRGLGLANMFVGYRAGVRTFDVCTGGLGGCPFVKGAAGNVPTEDAVQMFSSMGVRTGIDLAKICATVSTLEQLLGRKLPGRMKTVIEAET